MPSTFSGLISALSKGAQGYQTGVGDAEEKAAKRTALEQQRAIILHAQARQDAQDEEKRAMDRAGMAAKGVDMGGTSVSIAPPAVAPPAPVFDPSALSAGASSPSALVRPVDLGGVPKVDVTQEGPSYDPANDRSVAAIDARTAGAMERLQASLDAKATEGAANRDSRESEGAANRGSRETIAANRLQAQNANRGVAIDATGKEIGGRPVTGTARIGHIIKLTSIYTKPLTDGGLGLDPQTAQIRAQNDVDAIIAHGRQRAGNPAPAGAPTSGAPAGGPTTEPVRPKETSANVDPAVALAVKQIKDGKATLQQLEGSRKSDAYKAAVRAALGTP